MRNALSALAFAVATTFVSLSVSADSADLSDARACGAETYATHGVVKSFGPDKRYVNIAHDKIEGYMMAMTMSFEPTKPDQISGLAPGDKVTFTFTATDDGRRLLNTIKKQ